MAMTMAMASGDTGNFMIRCTQGANIGKPSPCPEDAAAEQSGVLERADTHASRLVSFVAQIPAQVFAKARARVQATYERLAGRYSKGAALSIIGAGLLAFPIPLPGASLIAAAPIVAAAELYLRLRAYLSKDLPLFLRRAVVTSATEMPFLWLARHGKTRLNGSADEDRIRGWSDVPLDAQGEAEAKRLADFFRDVPLRCLYVSNLKRSLATAEIIARLRPDLEIVSTEALRPWNVGDFTGQLSSVAHPRLERYVRDRPDEPLPGGESFAAFRDRCLSFVAAVLEESIGEPRQALLLSHFRNLKLVQAWIAADSKGNGDQTEIDLDVFFRWRDLPTGAVVRVEGAWGDWRTRIAALPQTATDAKIREDGASQRKNLWEYACPFCGGRAFNGDPATGVQYRGGGKCLDCAATFSIVGMKLKPVDNAPWLESEPNKYFGEPNYPPTLAVDLDGTLAEYDFWRGEEHFGKPRPGAAAGMASLRALGCQLGIFTTRGDTARVRAYLEENAIPFDWINVNPQQPPGTSGKVVADLYIDDRAVDARAAWPRIVAEVEERLQDKRQPHAVSGNDTAGETPFSTSELQGDTGR